MDGSRKRLGWGLLLTFVGIAGILYNFVFGFDFAGRVVSFLTGFLFGISLGMGIAFLLYSIRKPTS